MLQNWRKCFFLVYIYFLSVYFLCDKNVPIGNCYKLKSNVSQNEEKILPANKQQAKYV